MVSKMAAIYMIWSKFSCHLASLEIFDEIRQFIKTRGNGILAWSRYLERFQDGCQFDCKYGNYFIFPVF